jgi:hypothetical protein
MKINNYGYNMMNKAVTPNMGAMMTQVVNAAAVRPQTAKNSHHRNVSTRIS